MSRSNAAAKPPATSPETAVAVRGLTTIHAALNSERARASIAKAMDGANPDRVIAAAKAYLRTAERPDDILACDPNTFVLACIDAATDGLLPDGRDGYLIPRKGRVKWMPSWRGLIRLARRAQTIQMLHAEVVYQAEVDKGACVVDLFQRRMLHKPWYTAGISKDQRGPIVFAYCMWKVDGVVDFEIADRERLDTAKAYSGNPFEPDKPSAVWIKHEAAMSKKTAIRVAIDGRRLELPDAVREAVERALERDHDDDEGATVTQLPPEHAAPTGDPAVGWNGGQTSAAGIRSRGPKKTAPAPVDTTAREPELSAQPGGDTQARGTEREPGEDEGELFDDVDGGRSQAP